jgi:hypothetical protein
MANEGQEKSGGKPQRVRLTAASILKRYKYYVRLNWRSRINLNPVLMGLLKKTVGGSAFTHVVLDKLDEEGAQLSMRAAYEAEEGAIALEMSPTGRTASVLLNVVTAEWPGYRVEHGRLRVIGVEFRENEDPPDLLLNLKDSTIELAPKKTPRSKTGKKPEPSPTVGQVEAASLQPEAEEAESPAGGSPAESQ